MLVAIPVTSVVDKGSELGYFFGNQTALRSVTTLLPVNTKPHSYSIFARTTFAPDIDVDSFPPMVQVKSINNTPIEGCWHWFLKTMGLDFRDVVRAGLHNGIYNPHHKLHMYVLVAICDSVLLNQHFDPETYSNGYGLKYYRSSLTSFLTIGITTASDTNLTNQMSLELRPNKPSLFPNRLAGKIAG